MAVTTVNRAKFFDNILVNGVAAVESNAFPLQHVSVFESFVLRASSVIGTADVKVEYATSPDGVSFNSYSDNTPLSTSTATDFPNNKEGFNAMFPPANAPTSGYVKFRVTGVGANPADTLITGYGFIREGVR